MIELGHPRGDTSITSVSARRRPIRRRVRSLSESLAMTRSCVYNVNHDQDDIRFMPFLPISILVSIPSLHVQRFILPHRQVFDYPRCSWNVDPAVISSTTHAWCGDSPKDVVQAGRRLYLNGASIGRMNVHAETLPYWYCIYSAVVKPQVLHRHTGI